VTRLPSLARRGVHAAGSSDRAEPRRLRRSGCIRTGAVTSAAVLGATAMLAIAGCDGGAIGQNTPLSSGQNFVGSSYESTYLAANRPAAPAVSGTTLTGQHLSLSQYRGDVVVLNFWGSWCTPCRDEAAALGQLARQLAASGVRFVGVDIRDEPSSALAFMQDFNVGYPSINDPNDEIALLFHNTIPLSAIPSTVIIDRKGRIAARIVGGVTYTSLLALLKTVAAEHS
jgi:thiol-disulfide isomerase/thioredoxin